MHGNHLKQMLIAAAVILGVLIAVGVPPGRALTLAAVLACPLMMVAMMFMMGSGHSEHGPESVDVPRRTTQADGAPEDDAQSERIESVPR